jgi:hypothetical protein
MSRHLSWRGAPRVYERNMSNGTTQLVDGKNLPQETAPSLMPSRTEWLCVLLVLAALFGLDMLTYNYYPKVWCDDVVFSEPAMNFVKSGSFTTMVWPFQPPGTFPTVNCPTYMILLAGWLSFAGTSLLAIRSLNYVLMGGAAFLAWLLSWKFNLLKSPRTRLALVALMHLGYGISFSYRYSRADILGVVFLLLLALCFGITSPRRRGYAVLLVAAAIPWIALQTALYAAFATFVAWIVLRRLRFQGLMVVWLGLLLGGLSLTVFLAGNGLLAYFLNGANAVVGVFYAEPHAPGIGGWLAALVKRVVPFYFRDFSTATLLLGLAVLGLLNGCRCLSARTRRFVVACLIVVVCVPPLFTLAGNYAFYYSCLLYVPALFAFLAAGSELAGSQKLGARAFLRLVFVGTMLATALVGLPLDLILTASFCTVTPRSTIQAIVDSHITRRDVVFADVAVFVEVKRRADTMYTWQSSQTFCAARIGGHLVTPEERVLLGRSAVLNPLMPGRVFTPQEEQSVSVLVVRPELEGLCTNAFGGQWIAVTPPFGDTQDVASVARWPVVGPRLAHHFEQEHVERYQVQIFRRVSAGP